MATTFSSSNSGESVHGSCGEHVEAGGGDAAGLQGVVQRLLVDDAAARGVDQDQAGRGLRELVGADEADRLGGLGQVHADEVGLGHQLVEADHPHAHLGGAAGLHVGVVGDHVHAERGQPVRDEHADAAEPDDAERLLEQLDAGVAAALPLPARQRRVGRADVAGRGEHQGHGELGGAGDVGGRRVDDHHAVLRRGRHVDVVEADPGPGHDLEPRRGEQCLGVDAVAERTRIASTSAIAASSSARSAPLQCRISKSGPRASTVAGLSSSAMSTTGRAAASRGGERHNGPDVSDGGLPARRCASASVTDPHGGGSSRRAATSGRDSGATEGPGGDRRRAQQV